MVFHGIADPVALGLVKSLAHLGGNATGIVTLVPEGFNGKQFQLLKEFVPQVSRIAVLADPESQMHQRARSELPEFGRQLGIDFVVVEANGISQAEATFDAARSQGAQAIQVWGDPYVTLHSSEVVALAARYRLPAGYLFRQNVLDGGLISLGPDFAGFSHRAADYVDKILQGERPAHLPVWQPTGYHLAVNLKTAAARRHGPALDPLASRRGDRVTPSRGFLFVLLTGAVLVAKLNEPSFTALGLYASKPQRKRFEAADRHRGAPFVC